MGKIRRDRKASFLYNKLYFLFTTGTSAAAATKAALLALISGRTVDSVVVSLPKEKKATIKIIWTRIEGKDSATSAVIKYAGDDPDVTDGAEICSTVSFGDQLGEIIVDGGKGVGRVTKPGLGIQVGKAAINPMPLKMIEQAVREVASASCLKQHGINLTISVPKGDEIAKRTDNPRLGILGGISILGTTGIVLPYSTASFAASIRQSLDVSVALGTYTVVLTTGGRSEDFAKALFGKLTKMAIGAKQTHVRGSHVNMEFMAKLAAECNPPEPVVEEIRGANTARHVSEIINKNNVTGFFDLICKRVYQQMYEHSGRELDVKVIMFEFDGHVCGQYP